MSLEIKKGDRLYRAKLARSDDDKLEVDAYQVVGSGPHYIHILLLTGGPFTAKTRCSRVHAGWTFSPTPKAAIQEFIKQQTRNMKDAQSSVRTYRSRAALGRAALKQVE